MIPDHDDSSRLARFEAATRRPMVVVSLAVVPIYVGQALADDGPAWVHGVLDSMRVLVHVAMAADVAIRACLAPSAVGFLATHKLDVVAIVVPPIRTLRQFVTLRTVLLRPGLARFCTGAFVTGASCALFVFAVERDREGASITTVGDALWWAGVTTTTVGYGDHVPVSTEGRAVAAVLMMIGIALFAVLTAHIAAYFVGDDRGATSHVSDRLERIEHTLAGIEQRLDEATYTRRVQDSDLRGADEEVSR